jgi:hypothetical protein
VNIIISHDDTLQRPGRKKPAVTVNILSWSKGGGKTKAQATTGGLLFGHTSLTYAILTYATIVYPIINTGARVF